MLINRVGKEKGREKRVEGGGEERRVGDAGIRGLAAEGTEGEEETEEEREK